MESLHDTEWDVVIAGTGIQESLLAVALSRSGKKILHVDKNDYYGGAEAAFSLQEAETWAQNEDGSTIFSGKHLEQPEMTDDTQSPAQKLSFPRAYSLALAPQIIYTRSALLPVLVSSRLDSQLEFLAVGSWWVYSRHEKTRVSDSSSSVGTLVRIPSGREDVFADQNIEPRSKRALMKFLRFIGDFEDQADLWQEYQERPLVAFLQDRFALPSAVQQTILALTMIPFPPNQVLTGFALPRIARHLRSIGLFGPGFGAVIPKWGGLAEVAQVACRAGAVGGGVYVLANGLQDVIPRKVASAASHPVGVQLKNGDKLRCRNLVASSGNMPASQTQQHVDASSTNTACRIICVLSSPLTILFPPLTEGGQPGSVAVVVFPGIGVASGEDEQDQPQIYISVHSADTGECPAGQSVLYGSANAPPSNGFELLNHAISALLTNVNETPPPVVLWKLQYTQKAPVTDARSKTTVENDLIHFPPVSLDLAFDDAILENVKRAWEEIMGDEARDFLHFPARESLEDGENAENDQL